MTLSQEITKRKDNEDILQYYRRLKDLTTDGVLDVNDQQLYELLFNRTASYDHSSKARRVLDLLLEANSSFVDVPSDENYDNDIIKAIEQKKQELQKERNKFFDQRRELNKLITVDARQEYLFEKIIESAVSIKDEKPLTFYKYVNDFNENECIVLFSDWHYGMTAENIWQKFNTEICRQRVELITDRVVEKIKFHRPSKTHVVLLGDFAHGAIHASIRVASEELVCDQIMKVSELLAESINTIANNSNEIIIYSTYGNHLRTVQNKKDSIHADNMEKLIPWWLKCRLQNRDDISFCEEDYYEFIKLNVCGYNICATHGDLDKVTNVGKTINTIFNKKYGESIDYVFLGDKHHLEEFESMGIESAVVGSLCGTDEHANSHRLYSLPRQSVYFFNENGRDAIYNIRLDK